MRPTAILFILALLPICAHAQKKGALPKPPQQMPERDPVMVMDKLQAGKSKTYNWHGTTAQLTLAGIEPSKKTVNVSLNGKMILSRYDVKENGRAKSLKISKNKSVLVIIPDKNNKQDSFAISLTLADKDIQYSITTNLKKGKNDTIIIKHQ